LENPDHRRPHPHVGSANDWIGKITPWRRPRETFFLDKYLFNWYQDRHHNNFMSPFLPVKSGKVSELIAQQIKSSILNGSMKPGDRLPPERELVDHFQASRISVREALKSLETSGLLMIKPGSGVFVAEVNSKPMSESLSSILRIQKASINDITEARTILEPSIAKLASERITQEDLTKLEQNIHEALKIVKSNTPSPAQNIEFHSLIASSHPKSSYHLNYENLA